MEKKKIEAFDSRKWIIISGARENNLKNISVNIPKNLFTVITGPSGSGKSTVAFNIIYAEGQRRYIESLSSYARQFLGVPGKPDVDKIEGLCPAIAIDQKTVSNNPRSTVGTITEIYDYLRVLFARIGKTYCPNCHRLVQAESVDTITKKLKAKFKNKKIIISAPIVMEKKGEFTKNLEKLFLSGLYKFLIDKKQINFKSIEEIKSLGLKKTYKHSIDVLVDTLTVTDYESERLSEAVEKAFSITRGFCKIFQDGKEFLFSSERICIKCTQSFPEVEPRLFSFNSPVGACPSCQGLGKVFKARTDFWSRGNYQYIRSFESKRLDELDKEKTCSTCMGTRLNPLALSIKINDHNIFEIANMSIERGIEFIENLKLEKTEKIISSRLVSEIKNRFKFLSNVGLQYLTLNRSSRTLSGGESQRIRLATQIGSGLSGVIYILDEPSIGLHQRDNSRLIKTLKKLRDQGNTVVVVEHDLDTMKSADYIIDMGPAAGEQGGEIVANGKPKQISASKSSITGEYLSGRKKLERTAPLRVPEKFLRLYNADKYNLKNLTVKFPLHVLCGVSGVSGSGKSTLIIEELVPTLKVALANKKYSIEFEKIKDHKTLESLVVIDQSSIGKISRSNPATYLGIFGKIRDLFSSLPESNARGYRPGRFSFNVKEGRCSSCRGDGFKKISMHFLPDVIVTCSHCKGTRYNKKTLEILYRGKNISDILNMTATQALKFFENHVPIRKKLQIMCDIGLDYLRLGQPSPTLSGGEAQRIKLTDELAKRGYKTLYILDEPTTGLHPCDIEKLMLALNKLVEKGNSVIVIEHNLEVLKAMDYLIDMGPEGGDKGGEIIAQGTPEEVAKNKNSTTGEYLKKIK